MNRTNILKAIEFASKAVPSRATTPIQECLHLKTDDGKLTVTGSGPELSARAECECDLKLDTCVAAGRLLRNLSNASEDEISIESVGTNIILKAGTSRATIETLPAKDFPAWEESTGTRFMIPSEAIKRVLPAASTEESRYILNSAFLDKEGYVVGADGRRMHCVKMDEPFPLSCVIPTACAVILSGLEGIMRCDERRFTAEGDGWALTGKICEGAYPNWKAMLMVPSLKIPVPANLAAAVKRAAACSDDKNCERVDISAGLIASRNYEDELDMDIGYPFGMQPSRILAALKEAGDGAQISGTETQRAVIIENGPFTAVLAIMSLIS